jgi:hypothetical protein
VRANHCQMYASYMLFTPMLRKVAGAPGTEVLMGRGWGPFVWRPEEKVNFGLRGNA